MHSVKAILKKLVKKINAALKKIGFVRADSFQIKRQSATRLRWEMIRGCLDHERSRNLLDLGCNIGDLTALAVGQGYVTLGVDIGKSLIQEARKRHQDLYNAAFAVVHISPKTIDALPVFDVCLCLSVHHHWHREYGSDAAAEMLRTLLKKTNHALFFEPPSRRKRYGDSRPAFKSNDEDSVVSYHQGMLVDVLGDAAEIEYLGSSPCLGEREPFRCLFLITPHAR